MPTELIVEGGRGGVNVQAHLATEEVGRVEAAEHRVGVRHGRPGTAPAVAHRTGPAARAFRADAQCSGVVEVGDAAAAGADLDHVHDRYPHRQSRREAADVVALGDVGGALPQQGGLSGRPAHVERDRVGDSARGCDGTGRDHAADRPRLHHHDRLVAGDVEGHHAPVGLHDQGAAAEATGAEHALEIIEVAAHPRPDVGVHRRGGDALVLAVLAQDLVRQREVELRSDLADEGADALLVGGVGVRVQQADRDRLRAAGDGRLDRQPHAGLVERGDHVAAGRQSLVHLVDRLTADQRDRPLEHHVVGLGPVAPSDLVDVAHSPRHQDRRGSALALDRGVDGHRGAVHEFGRVDQRKPALVHAPGDTAAQVVRIGVVLGLVDGAGVEVVDDEVGERAADVSRYCNCHAFLESRLPSSMR